MSNDGCMIKVNLNSYFNHIIAFCVNDSDENDLKSLKNKMPNFFCLATHLESKDYLLASTVPWITFDIQREQLASYLLYCISCSSLNTIAFM